MQQAQTSKPVSLRQAAEALGLNVSTVSRYLKANPELNRGQGDRPLVDVAELRAHRAANPETPAGGEDGSLSATKAALLGEQLRLKRMERAEREGRLLDKAEVERAFFACGRRVRRKVELIETWAEELAAAAGGDPAALRPVLRAKLRAFQDDLAETLRRLPEDLGGEAEDAGDGEPAERNEVTP